MALGEASVPSIEEGRRPRLGLLLFFIFLLLAGFPGASFAYRAIPDEVKRGMDLVFEQRFAEAIEVLTSAVSRYPASPEAHFYLALSRYSSGMPAEAAAGWERTLELAPSFPRVRVNLALAYYDIGDMALAEKNARLAAAKEPSDHLAHLVLARALREQRRPDEALREFLRALDPGKPDPGTHAELGELYQDLGRTDEALGEFRLAVELAPANHAYRFLLGLAYMTEEKIDLAQKEFSEAIRLDPEDAPSYYNLGLVYLRQQSEPGVLAMIDVLKTKNPAWADELANAWTLQAGERESAASTETVPFTPRLVKGFTFASDFTRKGKLSFHALEGNFQERHEYVLTQTVRWEVEGGDTAGGHRVIFRQQSASSSLDGKPLEDPLLAEIDHSGLALSLDPAGRVLSVMRGEAPAPPAAVRHVKRLWSNAFLAGAPDNLAVGAEWQTPREIDIPLGGWRTLPSTVTVESFETAGGPGGRAMRSARLGVKVKADEECPARDLQGEGWLYLNPEGGWMSSSRLLVTGSLVVAVEGKNSQVQFSVVESQSNR
jgi:tetratricopeptide (TPR) repeat protein